MGGCSVNRYRKWIALLLAVVAVVCTCALADQISATVVMRVSRQTQSAVVNVGEDLMLEVDIEGVNPASCQWYFENNMIPGATRRVYNIVNAQVEDSGTYRMDAFGDDGRMLVSMEINARVIDATIPKSGDGSLPVGAAIAAFVLAAGVLALTLRRRTEV